MQIKITMRYHFIPVRMAIIKERTNKFWWGCGEKEHLRTIGGNVDCCNHSGKKYKASSKN